MGAVIVGVLCNRSILVIRNSFLVIKDAIFGHPDDAIFNQPDDVRGRRGVIIENWGDYEDENIRCSFNHTQVYGCIGVG